MDKEKTPSRIKHLMKLSIEERNKLMQKSAEELADFYTKDKQWKDFQAGNSSSIREIVILKPI